MRQAISKIELGGWKDCIVFWCCDWEEVVRDLWQWFLHECGVLVTCGEGWLSKLAKEIKKKKRKKKEDREKEKKKKDFEKSTNKKEYFI